MLLKNSELKIFVSFVGAQEKIFDMQRRSSLQQVMNRSSFGSDEFKYSSEAPNTSSLLPIRQTQSVRNLLRSGKISGNESVMLKIKESDVSGADETSFHKVLQSALEPHSKW